MPDTRSALLPLLLGLGFIGLCALAISGGSGESTVLQRTISMLILAAAAAGYYLWRQNGSHGLPLYSLMVLAIWSAYGPGSLLGNSGMRESVGGRIISSQAYDFTMLLVLIGIGAMAMGMYVRAPRFTRTFPTVLPTNRGYLRLVLAASLVSIAFQATPEGSGSAFRAALIILMTSVPMITLGILYLDVVQGNGTKLDRILCLIYVLAMFGRGIASGWLGPGVMAVIFLGLIHLFEKKRVAWIGLALMFCAMAFFQVGKGEFRRTYWGDAGVGASSYITRAKFWVTQSTTLWSEALHSPYGDGAVPRLLETIHQRRSLYGQTGNVVQMTPDIVPYQGLKLYSYVFVSWIPRALWRDKPQMNEANQFYQRAYLHASEKDLLTSISVGYLAEAYMSFGVLGVIIVMFLIGVGINWMENICFRPDSGSFLQVIGITLFMNLLTVESQMAQVLSSVLQVMGLSALILYPTLRKFPKGWLRPQQPAFQPLSVQTPAVEAGEAI